jgi:transcriptional regulator with XRE-family HTH domain
MTMEYLKIKDHITKLLKQKGITTKKMAADLGFTPQGYRLWFVEQTLRVRNVIDIAQYLDITPSELLFFSSSNEPSIFNETKPNYKSSHIEDRISILEQRIQELEESNND